MSHESESDIDLSLSCGSSSFDEGEIEDEDNHQTTHNYDDTCRGINPYQFEPYTHEIDSDANSDISEGNSGEVNADRLQNTSWCDFYKFSIFLHVDMYMYIIYEYILQ